MGFEPPRKVFNLVFEDPALAGLQVKMYELPLGDMLDLVETANIDVANFTVADLAAVRHLIVAVAENMKSWNVEVPLGTPVEPSVEAVGKQGTSMVMAIIQAWFGAMGEVEAPLGSSSPSSLLPDLSSIPMEALPASLAS
jgi:hypothetical protein